MQVSALPVSGVASYSFVSFSLDTVTSSGLIVSVPKSEFIMYCSVISFPLLSTMRNSASFSYSPACTALIANVSDSVCPSFKFPFEIANSSQTSGLPSKILVFEPVFTVISAIATFSFPYPTTRSYLFAKSTLPVSTDTSATLSAIPTLVIDVFDATLSL